MNADQHLAALPFLAGVSSQVSVMQVVPRAPEGDSGGCRSIFGCPYSVRPWEKGVGLGRPESAGTPTVQSALESPWAMAPG